MVTVKVVNKSGNQLPSYETKNSAGMDLRSSADVVVPVGKVRLIPTGLFIQLPAGYEAQVRSRSGLALKRSVIVFNEPGTVDADYRGEVGVILANFGDEDFIVKKGDRIAQMVIAKHEQCVFSLVDELDETERGDGGFGHTGV